MLYNMNKAAAPKKRARPAVPTLSCPAADTEIVDGLGVGRADTWVVPGPVGEAVGKVNPVAVVELLYEAVVVGRMPLTLPSNFWKLAQVMRVLLG